MSRHVVNRLLLVAATLVGALAAPGGTVAASKPANDLMSNAIAVGSLPFSATVDLTKATWSSSDPTTGCFYNGPNIWYTFTPSYTQMTYASTSGTWNAAFEVFSFNQQVGMFLPDACSGGGPAPVYIQMNAGVTYYIAITTADNQPAPKGTSTFTLSTLGAPPANDNRSGAFEIAPGTISGTDYAATADIPNDIGQAQAGQPNVWYKYTPTTNGRFSVQLSASTPYGFALSADSIDSTGTESFICFTSIGSACFFDTVVGVTYYIEIGGSATPGGGPFSFIFAPAPRIHPVLTVTSTGSVSRASGTATVSGTVTCDYAATFSLAVTVTQGTTSGTAYPSVFYPCSTTPTPWTASVAPATGSFAAGPATFVAVGTAYSALGDSDVAVPVTVSGLLTPR